MAMTDQLSPTANRVVVTWAGAGQPIMLVVYDPDGAVVSVLVASVLAVVEREAG